MYLALNGICMRIFRRAFLICQTGLLHGGAQAFGCWAGLSAFNVFFPYLRGGQFVVSIYDAAMLSLACSRGMRRPTMPEGLVIVPVSVDDETGSMKSFMVSVGTARPAWSPEISDLVAQDWEVSDLYQRIRAQCC